MVIYEVNLMVKQEVAQDYQTWLRDHVAEMCRLPGFVAGKIFMVRNDVTEVPEDLNICVHFHIDTMNSLHYYLNTHANEMRNQSKSMFGDKFQATRRILELT